MWLTKESHTFMMLCQTKHCKVQSRRGLISNQEQLLETLCCGISTLFTSSLSSKGERTRFTLLSALNPGPKTWLFVKSTGGATTEGKQSQVGVEPFSKGSIRLLALLYYVESPAQTNTVVICSLWAWLCRAIYPLLLSKASSRTGREARTDAHLGSSA